MHTRFATCVPAGTDCAHRAIHSVNQAAINITHSHAQFALAKVVFGRIGGLKTGQVQDADINSGDGGIGGFACLDPVHPQRHLKRCARRGFGGQIKRRRQFVHSRINRRIGQAQRAGRIMA